MAITGWHLFILCFSKPLFRPVSVRLCKGTRTKRNFHGIKPLRCLFHVFFLSLYDPLAQRDGKLKRGKKKKRMKNNTLYNTANKKSKSACRQGLGMQSIGMQSLHTELCINSNEENFTLSPREELYSKTIEQLYELLHISHKEYLPDAFSKEQLVEFILTPLD
jgi:hypothetical protein